MDEMRTLTLATGVVILAGAASIPFTAAMLWMGWLRVWLVSVSMFAAILVGMLAYIGYAMVRTSVAGGSYGGGS